MSPINPGDASIAVANEVWGSVKHLITIMMGGSLETGQACEIVGLDVTHPITRERVQHLIQREVLYETKDPNIRVQIEPQGRTCLVMFTDGTNAL